MSNDKLEQVGPQLAEIGGEIAQVLEGDPDGAYLYVEIGDRWYSVSLFRNEVEVIRYYDSSSELDDLIYEGWLNLEPAKRWAVMEYEINGTKFDAQFKFPEEIDVESFDEDRRGIALKKRYGDKPVIYPPWPGATE